MKAETACEFRSFTSPCLPTSIRDPISMFTKHQRPHPRVSGSFVDDSKIWDLLCRVSCHHCLELELRFLFQKQAAFQIKASVLTFMYTRCVGMNLLEKHTLATDIQKAHLFGLGWCLEASGGQQLWKHLPQTSRQSFSDGGAGLGPDMATWQFWMIFCSLGRWESNRKPPQWWFRSRGILTKWPLR